MSCDYNVLTMAETTYRNRRAHRIENDHLRVTVSVEGGHIAEILDKRSGVNPLWVPPWPSIEPSTYSRAKHPEYGDNAESKLLAGILGHNLCLDLFGAPSEEEAAAGMTVHGEGSIVPYEIETSGLEMTTRARLPQAGLAFERKLRLNGSGVHISEVVENLSALDRPSAWTQHVTLGPPFLEKGVTQLRASGEFGRRVYTDAPSSGSFQTFLMDQARDDAFFLAYSPKSRLLFGYTWRRTDFPWLGVWEENHSRTGPPWNGRTVTLGMEFGASPVAESRRKMIDRNSMHGVPGYRWIPARTKLRVEYLAFTREAGELPEEP